MPDLILINIGLTASAYFKKQKIMEDEMGSFSCCGYRPSDWGDVSAR
jgi:hypothetical protein